MWHATTLVAAIVGILSCRLIFLCSLALCTTQLLLLTLECTAMLLLLLLTLLTLLLLLCLLFATCCCHSYSHSRVPTP